MVNHLAFGVQSAFVGHTQVDTFALVAGQIVGTIVVFVALIRNATSGLGVSVTHHSLWTNAPERTGDIFTGSARVARVLRTLVNVHAAVGHSDEALHTLALGVETHFFGGTVAVRLAALLANASLVTDLAREAVVAGVAHLGTHVVVAPLANGAVGRLRTRQATLARDAHVSLGALITGCARFRNANTRFFRHRVCSESVRTLTLGNMVLRRAQGIRSAGSSQFTRVLAFVFYAGQMVGTVFVVATPDHADFVDASLPILALFVTRTWGRTDILQTLFTRGTILAVSTGNFTLAILANVATAIQICCATGAQSDTATLGRTGNWSEFSRATTNSLPVDDSTFRIYATGSNTNVHAFSVNTGSIFRTLAITSRAISFWMTTRHWIANLTGWTFTHVTTRANFADGANVARVRFASFHWAAFYIGNRVTSIAGWTLANRSVVFGDADGVFAASILFADVNTCVCHSVAQL
jgi:hypothetical protein